MRTSASRAATLAEICCFAADAEFSRSMRASKVIGTDGACSGAGGTGAELALPAPPDCGEHRVTTCCRLRELELAACERPARSCADAMEPRRKVAERAAARTAIPDLRPGSCGGLERAPALRRSPGADDARQSRAVGASAMTQRPRRPPAACSDELAALCSCSGNAFAGVGCALRQNCCEAGCVADDLPTTRQIHAAPARSAQARRAAEVRMRILTQCSALS